MGSGCGEGFAGGEKWVEVGRVGSDVECDEVNEFKRQVMDHFDMCMYLCCLVWSVCVSMEGFNLSLIRIQREYTQIRVLFFLLKNEFE